MQAALRIDHRQRLVQQHGGNVVAHQAAPQGDKLLLVGGEAAHARAQLAAKFEQFGDLPHPAADAGPRPFAAYQGKRQVLEHRHRLVDHRELENVGDVAPRRGDTGDIPLVEPHLAVRGRNQARDDVQHGGLAAAGRSEQGVGAAIAPFHAERLEGVIVFGQRAGVAVAHVVESNLGH